MDEAGRRSGPTPPPWLHELVGTTREYVSLGIAGMPDPLSVLQLYALGWYAMADSELDDRIVWARPHEPRPVLPIGGLHVGRSLTRAVRRRQFEITTDRDVPGVIRACAARPSTWLSRPIQEAFLHLHRRNFVHSVEARCDGRLVGGLYGLALGSAFIGESMFSQVPNASKVALVHLMARLRYGGFRLLDTQQASDHMLSLGAVTLPLTDFIGSLMCACGERADFAAMPDDLPPHRVLQLSTQMS